MKKIILGFLALFVAIGAFAQSTDCKGESCSLSDTIPVYNELASSEFTSFEKVSKEIANNNGVFVVIFAKSGCENCKKVRRVLSEKNKTKIFFVDTEKDAANIKMNSEIVENFRKCKKYPMTVVYNKKQPRYFGLGDKDDGIIFSSLSKYINELLSHIDDIYNNK